jgi:flagella synthesis protein FlgN
MIIMNSLLADLTEQCALIGHFLELLDQEAEALVSGAFAGLPALTERKAQLVDRIAILDARREQRQAAIDAADSDPELQLAWRALLERAALARDSNHRNGVMIHTHLDYTRQSLNFLRTRDSKPLYGPDGTHKTASGSGNSLASG